MKTLHEPRLYGFDLVTAEQDAGFTEKRLEIVLYNDILWFNACY